MTVPSDPSWSPDRISPSKAPEAAPTPASSNFQSYMGSKTPSGAAPASPDATTPMDLSRGAATPGAPSFHSISIQAKSAQDTLGTVQQQLNAQNLKLKRSQTHLLKTKLADSNSHIRAAGAKIGVDAEPLQLGSGSNPIGRFLAYVNDGQDQLAQIQAKLQDMSAAGQEIRPGDMMLVQVKMSLAQQEIEYSSTLLGKVIDSIKTILNTQL